MDIASFILIAWGVMLVAVAITWALIVQGRSRQDASNIIIVQLLNKIISGTSELDALRCVNPECRRRNTPDEKAKTLLYSVGYGVYLRKNQSLEPNCRPDDCVEVEAEQPNKGAAESVKDFCGFNMSKAIHDNTTNSEGE